MSESTDRIWELIAGKLHCELDNEELTQFEEWMEEPDNRKLFERAEKIYRGFMPVQKLLGVNRNHSWERIERRIIRPDFSFRRKVFSYAAVLISVCCLCSLLWFYLSNNTNKQEYVEIRTTQGKLTKVVLMDGTKVWLNSKSSFRYPKEFKGVDRKVFLNGEAFFDVAKDKRHPFKIETRKFEIGVLGTKFNVLSFNDEIRGEVVLVSGSLKLSKENGNTLAFLKPGQKAVIEKGTVCVSNVKTDFTSEWIDGRVVFDNERIEVIVQKLERWFNVKIYFADESLKGYRFSGTIIKGKPLSQTIKAFELIAPVNFSYVEHSKGEAEIIVTKK